MSRDDGGVLGRELLALIRARAAGDPLAPVDIEACQEALGVRAPTLYALLDELERHRDVDLADMALGIVRLREGGG